MNADTSADTDAEAQDASREAPEEDPGESNLDESGAEPLPEPLDGRVSEAQEAFERGDFQAVRSILSRLADAQAKSELGERDRQVVDMLARALVRDRFTLTLGIAAALSFSAIFVYYVVM